MVTFRTNYSCYSSSINNRTKHEQELSRRYTSVNDDFLGTRNNFSPVLASKKFMKAKRR